MPQTKLLYLSDSYLKTSRAKVVTLEKQGNQLGIILNQTIFYPQGGGQPADRGVIKGKNGQFPVTHVSYHNGQILHLGKLTSELKQGDAVDLELDWDHRYLNMHRHTAGHILDEAVKEIAPEFKGIEGMHGISNKYYIEFDGIIDASLKTKIQDAVNQIIANNEPLVTRMVTKSQIESENIFVPFKLPENKPLRLLHIGNRDPMPDGGTQLKSTGESWPIKIGDFEYVDKHTLIHYQVIQPIQAKSEPISAPPILTLSQFTRRINQSFQDFAAQPKAPSLQTRYLGKKGVVNQLTKLIPQLPQPDRAAAGKLINQLKQKTQEAFDHKLQATSYELDWLDVTQPGQQLPIGHLHPITQAIEEITRIFEHIGFTRVRYPEVDWDYYAFEALNMPQGHPARDEWETFFVSAPAHPRLGQLVLTPHTSNGQVREMERVKTPPIRMINIAKCYRRQQDLTHTSMFHQFEALVIDKGINIQHFKGIIDYFARHFYGPNAKSRLRPFHFQFTEPSFEVDFTCTLCHGRGCKFCKSGWHEVAGAGMVHPNVLKAGGIDPQKYTGFAFGMGVERAYTLKPGLQLDDIRHFYTNNLEFIKQF